MGEEKKGRNESRGEMKIRNSRKNVRGEGRAELGKLAQKQPYYQENEKYFYCHHLAKSKTSIRLVI